MNIITPETKKISLDTTIGELLSQALAKQDAPHQNVVFDLSGRQVGLTVFLSDISGYMGIVNMYAQSRDEYIQKAVDCVVEDIRLHGLPSDDEPIQVKP